MKYVKPILAANFFTCPHCKVVTEQKWMSYFWSGSRIGPGGGNFSFSTCVHCQEHTVWVENSMVFPDNPTAPPPSIEMPETVLSYYSEAALISGKSPRGAAALLRLSIQILCKELGESGTNINNDIANLVKKGLPEIVQQSLDAVRVTGNDAVHPGQIDTDDPEIVNNLFGLINIIVEYMIEMPKKVGGIYQSLPADKLKAIADRDK